MSPRLSHDPSVLQDLWLSFHQPGENNVVCEGEILIQLRTFLW